MDQRPTHHRLAGLVGEPARSEHSGGLMITGDARGDEPPGDHQQPNGSQSAVVHPAVVRPGVLDPDQLPSAVVTADGWSTDGPVADFVDADVIGVEGIAADRLAVQARLDRSAVRARMRRSVAAEFPVVAPAELRAGNGQGLRWTVSVRAAIAIVSIGALAAGWLLLRAPAAVTQPAIRLPTVAVSPPTSGGGAASSAAASDGPSGGAMPAAGVTVHVVGAVANPSVITLPSGSRVDDAITATGGTTPGADTSAINLARVLVDGEQVVIPAQGDSAGGTAGAGGIADVGGQLGVGGQSGAGGRLGTTAQGSAASGWSASGGGATPLVDVNTASADQLDALPGIGPVLAERIVDWRSSHGPFTSVDQLDDVSGIGPALMDKLRALVTIR